MNRNPVGAPTAEERVIFIPEISNWGGGERVLLSLSKYLNDRGLRHRIVSYLQTCDLQPYADWPVVMEQIDPVRHALHNPRALKRYMDRMRHTGTHRPLLVGIQAALHSGMMGLQDHTLMILDTPSLLSSKKPTGLKRAFINMRDRLSQHLIARSLRRAHTTIITTEVMALECETLYRVRPTVCHQGVPGNPVEYIYRTPQKGKPLRLLSVCRLEASKRIDWILRSLAELERGTPPLHCITDWTLDIVGVGTQEGALRRQAQELGLTDRVFFPGGISDAELEQRYGQTDLFLMPAIQGYGLPALEALTRHIPVVLHRDSGVSEALRDTPWAEIVEGDEANLTRGLQKMISRIDANELEQIPLPDFPTEAGWAAQVCRLCGWELAPAGEANKK